MSVQSPAVVPYTILTLICNSSAFFFVEHSCLKFWSFVWIIACIRGDWRSDHSVGDSKRDYFQKKSDAVWVVKYSSIVLATKLIGLSICNDCNDSPCLWQVPAAFPVESQFTFTNQSEGEPFPLENRSSMGELQVKQFFVISGWMVCILCNFYILSPVPYVLFLPIYFTREISICFMFFGVAVVLLSTIDLRFFSCTGF